MQANASKEKVQQAFEITIEMKFSSPAVKQAIQESAQKTAQVNASSLVSLNSMLDRV